MWCGSAIACALTRVPTGKVLTDPDGAMLAARVIREVGAVAAAELALLDLLKIGRSQWACHLDADSEE